MQMLTAARHMAASGHLIASYFFKRMLHTRTEGCIF
jgi:hypothetical protein